MFLGASSEAPCGRIIRDHEGAFVVALAVNLGTCTITMAELWGIYWGLFVCHNMGFRNVLVETNSSFAFSMVTLGMPESHICKSLL